MCIMSLSRRLTKKSARVCHTVVTVTTHTPRSIPITCTIIDNLVNCMRNITTRAELHHEAFSWRLTPYHARAADRRFTRTSTEELELILSPHFARSYCNSMGIEMVEDDNRRRGEKLVSGENSCPRAYRRHAFGHGFLPT